MSVVPGKAIEEQSLVRVAFVATSYPRAPGDAAGHFVRAEARAAVRAGHEVHVLSPGGVQSDPGIVGHALAGGALFGWPGAVARLRERPSRGLSLPRFWLDLRRELERLAPDHVVAHWLVPSAFPVLRADEIVCHGADVRLLLGLPRAIRERIVLLTVERAGTIRFVATALRDTLLASCGDETAARLLARATVVPPAVDVDERDMIAEGERPIRYVVAAGRFVPDKRFAWAIEACHAARVPLVLLGDGPEAPALRALVQRLGANVLFAGHVTRPQALGYVASASALIHPSAIEAAPTVVLEARALGVPVIATPAGDVARWAASDPGIAIGTSRDDLARLLARVLQARP